MRSPLALLVFIGCVLLVPKAALGIPLPLYVYRAPPTSSPTASPSYRPSFRPSSHPTSSPSLSPSSQPSSRPRSKSSSQPSLQPSLSAQPSSTVVLRTSKSLINFDGLLTPYSFGFWMTISLILLNILLCFVGFHCYRRKKQRGRARGSGGQNTRDSVDEVDDDDEGHDALYTVTEKLVSQALTGLGGWLSNPYPKQKGDGASSSSEGSLSIESGGSFAASEGSISVSSGMSSGADSGFNSYSSRTYSSRTYSSSI